MRCVLVHPFMETIGGAEQACLEMLKTLKDKGVDTKLLSDIRDHQPEDTAFANSFQGLKIVPYPAFKPRSNKFKVYQRLLHHKLISSKLGRLVGQSDIEFLTQDVLYYSGFGKYTLAYVHYPEYLLHLDMSNEKPSSLWGIYYAPVKRVYRENIDKVDLILCNSEFTRKAIKIKWDRQANVVYPPVDVGQFKPCPKESFVVTVGRFAREKNYEVVNKVAEAIPETHFLIVGRRDDRAYYQRIYSTKPKNVTLITDLHFDQLVLLLGRAKVYLHTMMNEHFGISIVEAMASGCLPVVHDSGGSKEIVHGIGHTYRSIEEGVEKIRKALQSEHPTLGIAAYAARFDKGIFRKRLWAVLVENGFF